MLLEGQREGVRNKCFQTPTFWGFSVASLHSLFYLIFAKHKELQVIIYILQMKHLRDSLSELPKVIHQLLLGFLRRFQKSLLTSLHPPGCSGGWSPEVEPWE